MLIALIAEAMRCRGVCSNASSSGPGEAEVQEKAGEDQHREGGIGPEQPRCGHLEAVGAGQRRADKCRQYPADAACQGKRARGAEHGMDGFGVARARDPVQQNADAGGKGEGKHEKKNVKKEQKFGHAVALIQCSRFPIFDQLCIANIPEPAAITDGFRASASGLEVLLDVIYLFCPRTDSLSYFQEAISIACALTRAGSH